MEPTPYEQERARLMAYQEFFGTEAGKIVLNDLQQRYLYRLISKDYASANNALGLAYIDGQRELLLVMLKWVNTPLDEQLKPYQPYMEEQKPYGLEPIQCDELTGSDS